MKSLTEDITEHGISQYWFFITLQPVLVTSLKAYRRTITIQI